MKSLIFTLLAVFALVFSGCSKDDDSPKISLSEIKITNEKIGVGQLIVGECNVQFEGNITYEWKDDYGFLSDLKVLNWKPSKSGNQKIYLTVKSGNIVATQEKVVNVYDCDYRYAFWGQDMADIMIYEMPNKPVLSFLPDKLFYTEPNDINTGHAYVITNSKVTGGIDAYIKKYPFGEYNGYIDDFKLRSAELSQKYGKPIKEEKILAPTAVDEEEFYGDYVLIGKLELRNTWETSTNTIILNLKKGSTSGTVSFMATYRKK